MASCFGQNIKLSIFGESHGEAIGVVLDGLPAGERLDYDRLLQFMGRRRPGGTQFGTKRNEDDAPQIISGLCDGVTTGFPLCAIIKNNDTRSSDYARHRDIPRPSHADYTAYLRYQGFADMRGGGHFSGRLTACLCIAGGIALQILERRGISIGAHLLSVGKAHDRAYDSVSLSAHDLKAASESDFPALDSHSAEAMKAEISRAFSELDSVGGVIEGGILGMPAGIGSPMFDGIENRLAQALFGVPAVKGLEFGSGFAGAAVRGSQNNDAFDVRDGRVYTATNNHGGILGGISSGMPIVFRVAMKPTPSIALTQNSFSIEKMENTQIAIKGRHDPCVAVRAVPVIEAVAAICVLDIMEGR